MTYNSLKKYNNQLYSGMRIGGSHKWHYDNGEWFEKYCEGSYKFSDTFTLEKQKLN